MLIDISKEWCEKNISDEDYDITAINPNLNKKILYNGPHSKAMDEIVTKLSERIDFKDLKDWPLLSLYLARVCSSIDNISWKEK